MKIHLQNLYVVLTLNGKSGVMTTFTSIHPDRIDVHNVSIYHLDFARKFTSNKNASDTGADGFVVVDLLPDEAHDFVTKCRANELSFVPLVSPTTTNDRLPYVASAADSFVYCVRSVNGRKELAQGLSTCSECALVDVVI